MADRNAMSTPVIDILQQGDELLIRTRADLRPEDVRVDVHDGLLEVHVPKAALRSMHVASRTAPASSSDTECRGRESAGAQPGAAPREHPERADRSHGSGTPGAEPPLGAPDEKDFWDAQRPLISEDRLTSIHLEGFTDEQADEVVAMLGDDAPEEAQGGSATGSDDFPAHGGFPSRDTDEE